MKSLILSFFLILGLAFSLTAEAATYVRGYYRNNGTYVNSYYRSSPNKSVYDNYSTYGNYNPYTGKAGTKKYYSSYYLR